MSARRLLVVLVPVAAAAAGGGYWAGAARARSRRVVEESAPRVAIQRVPSDSKPSTAPKTAQPAPHELERCFAGDAPGTVRPLEALLDRYAELFDGKDYASALACAEEAARVEPRSIEAHHDRAVALVELDRVDEAEAAFARALALDPDDPETLAGAADFYVNRMSPSNDHDETGLEYARRGERRVRRGHDRELAARLALIEAEALDDLGRSREALGRLDAALAAAPDDDRIRYERAVALFELCRFDEAQRAFDDVLAKVPDDPWAHHYMGLLLERTGDQASADRELARARTLDPTAFPAPVLPSVDEFRKLVDQEVAKLPANLRADLEHANLETHDLPDVTDLTAEEPPLSPTILGLYRGAPLGEADAEPRTIILYRKNLGRAVTSRDELIEQVRTTLLHELGHLRGEDDDELRARGLE